ncbi:uncharacterized protein F4817DRAFT_333815 [Daldinia loculata]|uniref:uncharacterized protein n=1 Tax=Daldinia loculata TaxID=103429 RepID=UPI0020C3C58C|nr:uncharacterized protein F4817DRAFT_333815 [Daldinia loculata]KAI1648712.1 hypothetical protein F4817DRAFT_333815 [Daldinia loculata]
MKVETSAALFALLSVASARPDAVKIFRKTHTPIGASAKFRREVPQEHSHEKFLKGVGLALNLNNVDQVQDPVFALLGNKAAAQGAGQVQDLDCLQQRVADQAFTNAKAANDVEGMTNALIFRALERNTGSVGLASVLCTETAKNPEIAAIQQHQDPASSGAAALNKQITLDLAVQLASIGADPQLALQSGTFAPGQAGDQTGAGNTCDVADDAEGCIFTQNLLVEDATAAEIDAAVAAGGGNANAGNNNANAGNAADDAADDGCEADDGTADNSNNADDSADDGCEADDTSNNDASNNNNSSNGGTATAGVNVNAFTGTVGSAPVPVISSTADKPFSVNGNDFLNLGAAIQRACDVQKNACANAANGGDKTISVADCDAQQQQCVAQNGKKRRQSVDTGSCGSPAISFGQQQDRGDEDAFAPVNSADFNHGSALKPAVITGFICSQLQSKCGASAATVAQCQEGAQAADSLSGQAAADAFNAALGA